MEEGGNRWSKPHVSSLSLHSLLELRSMLLNNVVLLDVHGETFPDIVEAILDSVVNNGQMEEYTRMKAKNALLSPLRHQHESGSSGVARIPLIRSLADIGRIHSSSKSKNSNTYNTHLQKLQGGS